MRRPKVIPQLYEAINAQDLAQTSGVVALSFTALKADVEKLHGLFANLENLTKSRAVSSPGLRILVQIVITCQHIHDRRILHQVLARSPRLDPGSKASIALNISKLSRYFSVSRFLLEAARKYPVFRKTRISAVYLRASNLPTTELDSITTDLIHRLLDRPKPWKLTSKFHNLSITAIEEHLRQEATLAFPVHAEVQMLFHYKQKSCNIPPRIICSNKQACFLCDLFFKIHGKFTIPSSHGRLYEKWALPEAVKSTTSADKDILTKVRSFVSEIENTLLRETQPARKSYPNPYESIILHSVVWSQPNQSTASARGSSASQRPVWCQDTISASKIDTISRTISPIPDAPKPTIKSRADALRSCLEASSTTTIRAPCQSNTLHEYVISSEGSMSSNSLHVSLKKGQPVWQEIFSPSHSFRVRTPHIHLTILQEEPFCGSRSQEISHNLNAGCGHSWLILEYLSDRIALKNKYIPCVDLLDVPNERDMILDYGTDEWPRGLLLYSKDDVISITYSSRKPVEGVELKM